MISCTEPASQIIYTNNSDNLLKSEVEWTVEGVTKAMGDQRLWNS